MSEEKTRMSSELKGFYKLKPKERIELVKQFANLTDEEVAAITNTGCMAIEQVDKIIENVIGTLEMPLGIGANFLINGKEYLVPMAIEEPSVVAAASNVAKLARSGGGFTTSSTDPIMIGQVHVTGVKDPFGAKMRLLEHKKEIMDKANAQDPMLVKFGGGCRDVEPRVLDTIRGPIVVVHLLVDCRDAMGANAVNTMAEAVAPDIERMTGGKVFLRIISNLAKYRLARAHVRVPKEEMGGEAVVDAVLEAYAFALADPFRAATHNKGIMNGISAVVIATGNDFRAVEAGAHSYAAYHGQETVGHYMPLTRWEKDSNGDLVGSIELPMAVGLIGGAVKVHPVARANVKILGVKSAKELGEVMAAVGLAQNLGALKALATEGIQRGHMKLHARNMAVTAGASEEMVDEVVDRIVKSGKKVTADVVSEIVQQVKKERGGK